MKIRINLYNIIFSLNDKNNLYKIFIYNYR